MPLITISVIAPGHQLDQEIVTLDLPPSLSVADLKGLVNAETGLAQESQQFYLNNQIIQGDHKTLEEAGVQDGDILAMIMRPSESQNAMGSQRRQRAPQPNQPSQRRQGQGQGQGQGQTPQDSETVRNNILANPDAMAQIRQLRPALADAIHEPVRFREVYLEMHRQDEEREQERQEQLRLLNEDPFNIEAQKKIEEIIRQETVQENLHFAYEHNPEVFGRVTMLYIPVLVNKSPVKAFVDSGAQTTIMSPACAETCGIMRLIDKRYSGVAKGVGTAQILGRVHSADIRIGNATMSCSFTVMEGKDVDLLLGLDMLKRFQAVIDLRVNKLIFGDGNEVSFLGEADIPKFEEAEPTIEGPNGTEIGAQSGTVKPAGSSSGGAGEAGASSSVAGGGSFQGAGRTISSSGKAPATGARGPEVSSTPAASAPHARPTHSNEKIGQLQSLGFSREQAIAALDACGGNVEYAAGLLFQG